MQYEKRSELRNVTGNQIKARTKQSREQQFVIQMLFAKKASRRGISLAEYATALGPRHLSAVCVVAHTAHLYLPLSPLLAHQRCLNRYQTKEGHGGSQEADGRKFDCISHSPRFSFASPRASRTKSSLGSHVSLFTRLKSTRFSVFCLVTSANNRTATVSFATRSACSQRLAARGNPLRTSALFAGTASAVAEGLACTMNDTVLLTYVDRKRMVHTARHEIAKRMIAPPAATPHAADMLSVLYSRKLALIACSVKSRGCKRTINQIRA